MVKLITTLYLFFKLLSVMAYTRRKKKSGGPDLVLCFSALSLLQTTTIKI
jgi:hypothetical protein